ncbi:MAG: cobalamin B12-binding domain-containing protein [Firmicutes bacterium]|nr:cobalamin B12-binding domain-containing protein [Bacillota bacterium]
MRVLLVQPRQSAGAGFKSISIIEPLGLQMVAGGLLPAHEVRILDLFDWADLVPALHEFAPQMCGISCSFTIDVYQAHKIANTVKELFPKTFVCVGGHHATLNPHDFLNPAIDAVVLGEGEFTARELADCLESGGELRSVRSLAINRGDRQEITPDREVNRDLDKLPMPARHLVKGYRDRYFLGFQVPIAALETARGCPFRCNFCSVWRFYHGRCRTKSPERVVEELRSVENEYVLITDDNFLLDVKRAETIGRELKKAGIRKRFNIQARSDAIVRHPELLKLWKDVGLFKVFIGFEKIDEKSLGLVQKQNSVANNEEALKILQKLDVGVIASFIVDPDYDRIDFAKLRDYVRRLKIYTPSFSVLTPLPGTELYTKLKDQLLTSNYELFDLLHTVLPTRLEVQEFYEELTRLYRSAYRRPEYLAKSFLHIVRSILRGKVPLSHMWRLWAGGQYFIDPAGFLGAHLQNNAMTPHGLLSHDQT